MDIAGVKPRQWRRRWSCKNTLYVPGSLEQTLSRVTDPLVTKAMALREGFLFAHLRGYLKVVMEMDCLEVVNLLNTRHNCRSVVAPIL
jgi:hypothetical protein